MTSDKINRIVILGSGNLATPLAKSLKLAGLEIIQIYGRTEKQAKILANRLNTNYTNDLSLINPKADLYILCLSDDALLEAIGKIKLKDPFIVHTSGTTPINIFGNKFSDYGVFYPLQTFSKEKEIDFINIPLCIEANTANNEERLLTLAQKISKNVLPINSDQRKILHIGAVFASNFTNYLYSISKELLAEHNLSFNLLKPLIQESALKILDNHPEDAQTGPARRGDDQVIEKHLHHLKKHPEYKNIYKLFSKLIKDKYADQ